MFTLNIYIPFEVLKISQPNRKKKLITIKKGNLKRRGENKAPFWPCDSCFPSGGASLAEAALPGIWERSRKEVPDRMILLPVAAGGGRKDAALYVSTRRAPP